MLATTMLGKGSVLRGMGQKEVSSSVCGLGDSTSAGATRNAPRTLRNVLCVQWAMAIVARLCATRTGGVSQLPTKCSMVAIQFFGSGSNQSACSTRI